MIRPIHPFPARMAPEIALSHLETLPLDATVLDPMMGSGTVIRFAAECNLQAIGVDSDPLAVLMASVWTSPISVEGLRHETRLVLQEAEFLTGKSVMLPWIDQDPSTRSYVNYWFGPTQQDELRRISHCLMRRDGPIGDALKIALSRIIITKDRGASLGRDVSHSRPHRVMLESDFSVLQAFRKSADRVASLLDDDPPPGRARVYLGDARKLTEISDGSIDACITSPPYLNAIDYLRGHRLSLVWLGFQVGGIKTIRACAVGAERSPDPCLTDSKLISLLELPRRFGNLPSRIFGMIERYILDIYSIMKEVRRVVRRGGEAVFVVGNSRLRGVFIDNSLIVCSAAEEVGLHLIRHDQRELPPNRRYLPPPAEFDATELRKRMRTESVLTFTSQ